MKTDTPRTDALLAAAFKDSTVHFKGLLPDFSRQLERELSGCKLSAENASSAVGMFGRENAELRRKIKEALEIMEQPSMSNAMLGQKFRWAYVVLRDALNESAKP